MDECKADLHGNKYGRKSFEQLTEEKADCFEFGMNGYPRIFEQGEINNCKCKSCIAIPQ